MLRSVFLFTCVTLSSCASTGGNGEQFVPSNSDESIVVNLSRQQVLNQSLPTGRHVSSTPSTNSLELLAISILAEIAIAADDGNINSVEVYGYPEGYKNGYMQYLKWGENRIYMPREFAVRPGYIIFEVTGSRRGRWMLAYDPFITKPYLFETVQ